MRHSFALFASYNAEMNHRAWHAAQQLSHDDLIRNRGAFFGSILGTLNHLLVGDILWLHRMATHPARFASLRAVAQFDKPASLDQVIVHDLAQWHAHRVALDQIISAFTDEINNADLESILFYNRTDGMPANKHLRDVLIQFFNHQTHHRGQVSTLLFQAGVDIGVTDIMAMIPNVTDN